MCRLGGNTATGYPFTVENRFPEPGLASVITLQEKHSQEGAPTQRSLHCAPPDFRVRFGRVDKGEGGASRESRCWTGAVFHHLGWSEGP
jgi:hypothetical protein